MTEGTVETVEDKSAEVFKSPKVLIAPVFPNLEDGDRIFAKKFDRFGHVRSMAILGTAPNLRFAVQYSKITEAENAVNYFRKSKYSIDEPKLIEFCPETIKVSNFKGTVPELYGFILTLDSNGLKKVYESPEEDDVKYVDLCETGSARTITKSLSKYEVSFQWGGFSRFTLDRPFISRNIVDIIKVIRGSETRVRVTLSNIPPFFDPKLFQEELTSRLKFTRSISLDEMITSFEMPFDSERKCNKGKAEIKFRSSKFLNVFYEEFQGFKFAEFTTMLDSSTPKQTRRFRIHIVPY
ncbi:hypothetical protein PHJA_000894200 [Phtheirospermum japonicum]|uniref:Uncharacterized protein n=1 Tax=Phtheirospermum japonicum TaxID=374723 RepID=A0A830BVA0_9LAMI|nr:hypothetical protein PHJA_000894200 [Phtheirospermum japonicum]